MEIYDGGVIVYSMGNLVFGHNHDYWDDNFMTRLTLEPDRVAKVEILPIAGRGTGLSQPYQLEGQPAKRVLSEIQLASQALGTYMEIQGDLGVIQP